MFLLLFCLLVEETNKTKVQPNLLKRTKIIWEMFNNWEQQVQAKMNRGKCTQWLCDWQRGREEEFTKKNEEGGKDLKNQLLVFSHLETRKTRCLEEKKTLSPNNKDATNLASGLERKNRGVAAGNGRAEAMPTNGAIQWSCAKCLQIRCLTRRLDGTILPGVLQQNIFKVPNSAKFVLLMFPSISRRAKIAEFRLKYPVRIFST